MTNNKYQVDPTRKRGQPDIIEYIKDMHDRLGASDVSFRIGHTSIEDGDLVVLNGDIRVKEEDGTTVLRILHGSTPEIRMFPLGDTDTHQIAWFGFDFGSPPTVDQAMLLEIERISDLFQDGGKLFFTRGYAVLSHQNFGGQETYIWLDADAAVDEVVNFRGKMRDSWQYDTRQMFYAGTISVSSGLSTWTHTYASSWADTILPVCTVNQNGSTVSWNLDSYTVSAFTVRFSSTVSGKNINFFNVRCSS